MIYFKMERIAVARSFKYGNVVTVQAVPALDCHQEEANTGVFLHISHAASYSAAHVPICCLAMVLLSLVVLWQMKLQPAPGSCSFGRLSITPSVLVSVILLLLLVQLCAGPPLNDPGE